MGRIKCINCEAGEHATVREVRECWDKPTETPEAPAKVEHPAVKPELLYFIRTQTEDFFKSLANYYDRNGFLTPRQTAAAEKAMQQWAARKTEAPEGVHVVYTDGPQGESFRTHYKVQVSVHGSGRKYVKIFDPVNLKFERCTTKGMLFELNETTLLNADEAAAFGHLYGICAFCARTLTDERSIHVGYGPVCADNQGLPWGEDPTVDLAD